MSRLSDVRTRLAELKINLSQEEGNSDRSQSYIDDLNHSIKCCEHEIKQLKFAKANPDPMLINGAVVG